MISETHQNVISLGKLRFFERLHKLISYEKTILSMFSRVLGNKIPSRNPSVNTEFSFTLFTFLKVISLLDTIIKPTEVSFV